MKQVILAGMVSLLAIQAFAQQAMDGSAKQAGAEALDRFVQMLVGKTSDPYSAQFIRIRKVEDDTCGLVNLKNQYGGYTGFQTFMVSEGVMFLQDVSKCH